MRRVTLGPFPLPIPDEIEREIVLFIATAVQCGRPVTLWTDTANQTRGVFADVPEPEPARARQGGT